MTTDLARVARGPSIYEFIRDHLDAGGRLGTSDMSLPDEADAMSGDVKWAPGAMDGVMGHHAGGGSSDERAAKAADAFARACARPSKRRLRQLYEAVRSDDSLGFLDETIERLVQLQPNRTRLYDLGLWLATTAADRGAVKFGIAMMGIAGSLDNDVAVVRTLGAHDEFTLYAAVALSNGLSDPESELWALAASVDGWGRIHCVERLANTTDPAIRSWILREGFRNSVMYEYLAYIAATTGGLLEALQVAEPDRDLLTAAGQIFDALVSGGPAEDITFYADGADAVAAFLSHMDTRAETLGDFHAIVMIRQFLLGEYDWDELSSRGWTASRREAFEARCDELLSREAWGDRLLVGLHSDDRAEFWRANEAARWLGIDTYAIQVERIRADPRGGSWYDAWKQADVDRADELTRLARELLPLDEIATGPADEAGFGPGWQAHTALDWTLQALRAYPGVGADLVLVGLQSPMTRNRNMALNIMKEWPAELWPAGAADLARALGQADPNEKTRELAAEVVRDAQT